MDAQSEPTLAGSDGAGRIFDRLGGAGQEEWAEEEMRSEIATGSDKRLDPDRTVSVVIATKERPELLREALRSVDGQTYPACEVIVVDDGSFEPAAVERVAGEFAGTRVIRLSVSLGPRAARNRGIREAKGDFVAILDDDDLAKPVRLERQLNVLLEGGADLTFSSVEWFRSAGEPIGHFPGVVANRNWPSTPAAVFELLYVHGNKVPNTTIMGRRELFLRFPYPEWTRIGEDWFVFLQMAASGVRLLPVCEPLVRQRRDPCHESLVRNQVEFSAAQAKVLRAIEDWLEQEGKTGYRRLRRRAWSNLYAREAIRWSGFRGLGFALRGAMLEPRNKEAWQSLERLCHRAALKGLRLCTR